MHKIPSEPIEIYSELDKSRWEIRKVEVFADGRMAWADSTKEHGATRLAIEPLPALDDIKKDPQFVLNEITKEEFENIWVAAGGG